MNKQQFLDALKKELCGLSQDDIQESLDFYSEMIDDHIEEGLSEEEAVASIGHPKEIAKEKGLNEVELDVWTFNDSAVKFYHNLGFKTYRELLRLKV